MMVNEQWFGSFFARKWQWHNLRCHPDVRLESLSRFQDLRIVGVPVAIRILAYPNYKWKLLPLESQFFLRFIFLSLHILKKYQWLSIIRIGAFRYLYICFVFFYVHKPKFNIHICYHLY